MATKTGKKNQQVLLAKNNFARAAHFLVHLFAVVLHDYNVKRPETPWLHILGGNVECVPVQFFLTSAHFHLGSRKHFFIFSPPRKYFHVFIPNEIGLLFFISRSSSFSVILVIAGNDDESRKKDSALLFFYCSL